MRRNRHLSSREPGSSAALGLWSAFESTCKMRPPDILPKISFSGLPLAYYAPCAFIHSRNKRESCKVPSLSSLVFASITASLPVAWPLQNALCFQTNEAVLFMLINPGKRLRQWLPADRPLPRHYFRKSPQETLGKGLRQRGCGIKVRHFPAQCFELQTRFT